VIETTKSDVKKTFLVVYRPGPGWLQDQPLSAQPLKEHGRYMLSLFKKGSMKLAGGFADNSGGAMLLEVVDESEARAIVAEDPAVKKGIFLYEIHPWKLVAWEKYLHK
ncbi:MAG: YciI family protein, partial [Anaerolineae bacterium]|nr:YciI family protein [Anaerolineae bacterium]